MKANGYASGTNFASAGLHKIDEIGTELQMKQLSYNGRKYTMLQAGDQVMNADMSSKIFDFAKNPAGFIANQLFNINGVTPKQNDAPILNVDYNLHIDNADANTATQLKKIIPEIVGEVTKEFSRELRKLR